MTSFKKNLWNVYLTQFDAVECIFVLSKIFFEETSKVVQKVWKNYLHRQSRGKIPASKYGDGKLLLKDKWGFKASILPWFTTSEHT